MYCNEAIVFFKHPNDITNRYLYLLLLYNDVSRYASRQIGSLNKTSFGNINIPIPSLEIQQDIVNKIQALGEPSSHYNQYHSILEQEMKNIMETIHNMTIYIEGNKDIIEEFDLNDNAFSNSDEQIDEDNNNLNSDVPTVENNDNDLIDMAMDTGASIGLKADKKKNSKVCVEYS